jgi:hypothetical protein
MEYYFGGNGIYLLSNGIYFKVGIFHWNLWNILWRNLWNIPQFNEE